MAQNSASTVISRRQFLRADFRAERTPLRPPWARPEPAFLISCTACGACIGACPQRVLRPGRRALPEVDFRGAACTWCGLCVEHCAAGALVRVEGAPPWRATATIAPGCLTTVGVSCRICGDHCEQGAINFRPTVAAPARPCIEAVRCSGCGACVRPCPADAIRVRAQDVPRAQAAGSAT